MLERISKLITGDILKVLCDMGHGDELVIADANFPAETVAACTGRALIRMPGVSASEFLESIIALFPVDWKYCEQPALVMERTKEDAERPEPEAWKEFASVLSEKDGKEYTVVLGHLEREAFYERAKKAYCVIQTGEERQYGNLILKKGVVV